MMQFTEEQRKAITERAKVIASGKYGHGEDEKAIAEIALAALTAKPVGTIRIEMDWNTHRNVATLDMREDLVAADMRTGDELYTAPPVAAPAVPDGWKLVPIIAFPSQWAAGQKAFESAGMNKVDAVYKAMVAAAPEKPQ